jgi:hypothetical protein
MASRKELVDKIQAIAKRVYAAKTGGETSIEAQEDTLGVTPEDVNFDNELFPVLTQFPSLKGVVADLLTDQYEDFISDIWWVAPRPTTFKIILANDQFFYLIYTERSWIAKIEGKKYYLSNLNEEERAAASIARILVYGGGAEPEKEEAGETPMGEIPTGGEMPADETVPEPGAETPFPETPAAEEPEETLPA